MSSKEKRSGNDSDLSVSTFQRKNDDMLFFIFMFTNGCYASKLQLRIYGGTDAKSDEYPYVVRIEEQIFLDLTQNTENPLHTHHCTGSALSPVWVLSAAHCIIVSPEEIVIRYGHVKDLFTLNKDSFSIVLYTIKHPLYAQVDTIKQLKLLTNHDIGLLKTTPMNIKNFMKVSAVDFKTLYGYEAVIAGFGLTTKTNAEGKVESNTTLALGLPLQLLTTLISKCSNSYISLEPGMCLAPKCTDVNMACGGDSGGPLIHPSGLIGLLALGIPTGFCLKAAAKVRVDTAGYVVPITPYIEWIYSYVNA